MRPSRGSQTRRDETGVRGLSRVPQGSLAAPGQADTRAGAAATLCRALLTLAALAMATLTMTVLTVAVVTMADPRAGKRCVLWRRILLAVACFSLPDRYNLPMNPSINE